MTDAIAAVAAKAVIVGAARLAARITTEAPGVAVSVGDGVVTLSAPGLVARIFGSRRRGGDPRLAALVGGSS